MVMSIPSLSVNQIHSFESFVILQIKSWKFLEEDMIKSPALIVEIFCRFLFFSVSTATLCGKVQTSEPSLYTYWTNKVRDQISRRIRIASKIKHFYYQGYSFCKLCMLGDRNDSLCLKSDYP